jgi:hypothetical protein
MRRLVENLDLHEQIWVRKRKLAAKGLRAWRGDEIVCFRAFLRSTRRARQCAGCTRNSIVHTSALHTNHMKQTGPATSSKQRGPLLRASLSKDFLAVKARSK